MSGSVLEDEVERFYTSLRRRLGSHDRAVLIGFLCSLTPLFPLAIVGFGIGLLNRSIYKAGKITRFDYRLVQKGLIIAFVNSLLSLLLLFLVIRFVDLSLVRDFVMYLPTHLSSWIESVLGRSLPDHRGIQI